MLFISDKTYSIKYLLKTWGIIWNINPNDLSLTITILATILIATYIYNKSKNDGKENKKTKQISLLKSLYYELDAISNKEKIITFLDKEIHTKGNLQWIKELLTNNGSPAHGIWNLNTRIYVTELDTIINNKKTQKLKESLIHLNQKIELIGNYLLTHRIAKEKYLHKESKIIGELLIPLVEELIDLTDRTKKYLEKEFNINKK